MTFQRQRPDLKLLLEHIQNNADATPLRLKAYLIREKLWDGDSSSLTKKGLEVEHSGLFGTTERGLYHVWYTEDDPLLGTRPVFIQRDTAFFNPGTTGWLSGNDARCSSLSVEQSLTVNALEDTYEGGKSQRTSQKLTLSRLEPEVICSPDQNATLELKWNLGPADSRLSLEGQLDVLDFGQRTPNSRPEAFEMETHQFADRFSAVMRKIADQFDGQWHETDQRMRVQLEQIQQHASAVQNFALASENFSNLITDFGLFASVKAENVPIKPVNQSDAELWHRNWLEACYDEAYQSSEKARQKQTCWLDHVALADYELPLLEANNLLELLSRESTPKAYWHAAALADLSPAKSKKQRLPITLLSGDALNLKRLVNQLAGGEVVQRIIYSDRYVYTSRQKRNLASVAACASDADGLLLTLAPNGDQEAELPDNWERQHFKKQHDNHGRFWIFIGASHTYCWECSIGLDFIRENSSGFVIEGTPGFTPKEEHELPHYLQELVRNTKSVEVAR
ncbi:hypothetical protein C9993_04800 [Marinobacter sp. Z-F4-2]|nr:hypothetical protein C9993_04800 [Marinobacter sp. Z-F4-2]